LNKNLLHTATGALALLLGVFPGVCPAADINVPRVSTSPKQNPVNIDLDQAKQIFGADVVVDNRRNMEEVYTLVSNDEALPYVLPSGSNDIEITFSNSTTISRVNVINRKVHGTAQVWVSGLPAGAGNNSWRAVSKKVSLSSEGVTPITFGSTSARALRVVLQASNKEEIGPVEAFGTETYYAVRAVEESPLAIEREPTIREVTNQISACSTMIDARVTHLQGSNGKNDADSMIDGDANTEVVFEGGGPYIAIIGMRQTEPIRRLSMLTSRGVKEVKVVPLMSLDDGNLAAALDRLDVGPGSGAAPNHMAFKLVQLLIAQNGRSRNNLGYLPKNVRLPSNYFQNGNTLNIPTQSITGEINFPTAPMQYLVLQIIPTGTGPVSIREFNAYTDPRQRRYGALPDYTQDGYQSSQMLDNLFQSTIVPIISK